VVEIYKNCRETNFLHLQSHLHESQASSKLTFQCWRWGQYVPLKL
jgi:hypothetical protein